MMSFAPGAIGGKKMTTTMHMASPIYCPRVRHCDSHSTFLSGLCNVLVGHPIDLVKVRMQTATTQIQAVAANINTFGALRNIYVSGGVAGLYQGVSAPLIAAVPAFATAFWSYDVVKTSLMRSSNSPELTLSQTLFAGGCSGVPLAFVVGPSERIKCLMQVKGYSSFTDCARAVYKEGGLKSIFRGCGATMLRDVPGNAAYFGSYEMFKRQFAKWEERETASFNATFLAGGLAGMCNWIVAIPFDVLKTKYQTAPPGMYRGLSEVLRDVVQKEGFAALFRGLSPALIRAFPANGACLAGVEAARSLFSNLQES
jgi:solute carrier family 25 carnitine/acylcarnitine transporter 20/29